LVLREWYETMNANDCLTGHDTWNQLIEYVKHSACTEFIIHSTCSSTGQAFRFTETGNFSQMFGSGTAGHDMTISANDADMRPRILLYGAGDIKLDSGDDVYFLENGAERFQFYDGKSIDFLGDRAIHIDDDETYVGHGAGDNIGAGTNNTFVGHDTGQANSFSECAFFGCQAGKNNTQNRIVAVGYDVLADNTGEQNTGIGALCLRLHTSGVNTSGLGYAALYAATTGANNTAVGAWALGSITIGANNTALGAFAGYQTAVDISGCVFLGDSAGRSSIVNNRLYINNSNSAFPLIYGEFDNDIVKFGNNNALFFFKFSHDANDAIVETEATNRSIYLKPHGTGLVKWGTEVVNVGSDRGKLIAMETAAGTIVYLKTYDMV